MGSLGLKAAFALGELGDDRAVKPLIQLLKDHDSRVRTRAEKALRQLGWEGKSERPLTLFLEDRRLSELCTQKS